MRMSQFDLDAYNARLKPITSPSLKDADDGLESILLNKIIKYCQDNGFYFFHDRSRNENKKGHPDLVIAMPKGRTLWIETKAKNGRLSHEQKVNLSKLKGLEHESYVLNNFESFLSIVNGKSMIEKMFNECLPDVKFIDCKKL